MQLWYLDDGVIAGRFEDLELLLRELGASFQDIGLILNTTKCKLFTIGDPSNFDELSRIPCERAGLEVLGTPLGNEDFVDKSLNAKFSKAHAFCDAVVAVDDPQTCLALLKLCAGTCHILHLLKVVPPSSTLKYAAGLDDKMVDTFQLCMGLNLTPLSLAQVFLPSRDGRWCWHPQEL